MRFVFESHGCRANQADGDGAIEQLAAQGHERVAGDATAEIAVVNGCAVTHRAVADARAAIRKHTRLGRRVVVTGCVANAEAQALGAMPGVEMVLGTEHRDRFEAAVEARFAVARSPSARPPAALIDAGSLVRTRPQTVGRFALSTTRARSFIKIQDGCNYRCAFCIVPSLRGRSRSVPLEEVCARIDAAVAAKVPEVVLTGVHIGTWGWDHGVRPGLVRLLRAVLDRADAPLVRLGTLDPQEVSDELIELLGREHRLCPQLHLGLQSGSPRILGIMRRGHTVADLGPKLARLRALRPDIAVTGDIIAGFPGERERDLEASLAMLDALDLEDAHVFGFSVREGTEAATLDDHLPAEEIKRRVTVLKTAVKARWTTRWSARVGTEISVVTFRNARRAGVIEAHAGQGARVVVTHGGQMAPTARRLRVTVTGVEANTIAARWAP